MFKKNNMFKKVQLRFFGIVMSILLTTFIALLASINLIMEAVMQRQSKYVLKQIASSLEYDDTTESFTFVPKNNGDQEPPKEQPPEKDPPPDKPQNGSDDSSTAEETTSADKTQGSTAASSTEESTSPSTQKETSAPSTRPTDMDQPSSDAPAVTTATAASTENSETTTFQIIPPATESKTEPTAPNENNGDYPPNDFPPFPDDGHHDEPPWGNGDYHDDRYHHEEDWQYPPDCHDWQNFYYGDQFWYKNPDEQFYEEQSEDEYAAEPTTEAAETLASLSGKEKAVLDGYSILTLRNIKPAYENSFAAVKGDSSIPKNFGSIDFFVLMADKDGNLVASLNNEELSADTAQKYISAIIDDGSASGMLNSYQFCSLDKDNGKIMVFTDKSAELEMLDQLMHTTLLIGAVSFVLLSILAYYLSKKCIEPVKIAFDKQKQFISDASHELKTPLTIISANADVLSDEIGSNKWLTYIHSQTERMNVLVNDLLNLTRLENNSSGAIFSEFDLSKAVENTALPFECRAFEENKKLEINVQNGLSVKGSEQHIKQMTAIFIDNALKYSNDGGTVRVTLTSQSDKKILSIFNTGSGIKENEKDKIFERFYRSDDSRSRMTGGYGLGLAIAKSVIENHRFKLSIDNHEGESICFTITMQ